VDSPQWEKYTIGNALEKGMGGLGVEWNRRCGMKWSFTGCLCVDFCARITAVKRNGMTAWIVEWND